MGAEGSRVYSDEETDDYSPAYFSDYHGALGLVPGESGVGHQTTSTTVDITSECVSTSKLMVSCVFTGISCVCLHVQGGGWSLRQTFISASLTCVKNLPCDSINRG